MHVNKCKQITSKYKQKQSVYQIIGKIEKKTQNNN